MSALYQVLDESTQSFLAVHFSGKVTGQEYQQFLDAIHERLQAGSPVSLVIDLTGFEFYDDLESIKKDFKFGFGDYKQIQRAAFVGDQKWIGWFARLVGPFTRAEEKHFPSGEIEAAMTWALA